mgnify:CR=1 FL=1|tara:strand:- start:27498 stop:28790 length:1293 start_codon:yes stop_codon:yes gene_type:complete
MKKLSIVIVFLFFVSSAFAQTVSDSEANSGSIYSFYGVGTPILQNSAQEKGMGIFGVSSNDLETSGLSNPAFWGLGAFVRGTANFTLAKYNAEDSFSSSTNSLFEAGTIHVVFPIVKQKLGVSAALYPVTRTNFKSSITKQLFPNATDTLGYQFDKNGSGGISKLEFGFGYAINKYIAIGYAPSLAFMRTNSSEKIDFSTSGYSTNTVNTDITASAFSQRFGILFSKRGLLNNNDIIQLGSSVVLPVNFDAKSKSLTTKVINGATTTIDLDRSGIGNVSLPLQVSGGLTYFASPYFNVSADGLYEEWSKAKYELNLDEVNNYSDRFLLGIGAQFHPYRKGSDRFFSKFRYSAGVSYDKGHLTIDNQDINTLWFSTGLGVFAPRSSRSSFDLSIQYGIRGTTTQNLVQEKIWAINFSVNLTELMFIRPKLN